MPLPASPAQHARLGSSVKNAEVDLPKSPRGSVSSVAWKRATYCRARVCLAEDRRKEPPSDAIAARKQAVSAILRATHDMMRANEVIEAIQLHRKESKDALALPTHQELDSWFDLVIADGPTDEKDDVSKCKPFVLLNAVCEGGGKMPRLCKYILVLSKALQGSLTCLRESCGPAAQDMMVLGGDVADNIAAATKYVQQIIGELEKLRGSTVEPNEWKRLKEVLQLMKGFEQTLLARPLNLKRETSMEVFLEKLASNPQISKQKSLTLNLQSQPQNTNAAQQDNDGESDKQKKKVESPLPTLLKSRPSPESTPKCDSKQTEFSSVAPCYVEQSQGSEPHIDGSAGMEFMITCADSIQPAEVDDLSETTIATMNGVENDAEFGHEDEAGETRVATGDDLCGSHAALLDDVGVPGEHDNVVEEHGTDHETDYGCSDMVEASMALSVATLDEVTTTIAVDEFVADSEPTEEGGETRSESEQTSFAAYERAPLLMSPAIRPDDSSCGISYRRSKDNKQHATRRRISWPKVKRRPETPPTPGGWPTLPTQNNCARSSLVHQISCLSPDYRRCVPEHLRGNGIQIDLGVWPHATALVATTCAEAHQRKPLRPEVPNCMEFRRRNLPPLGYGSESHNFDAALEGNSVKELQPSSFGVVLRGVPLPSGPRPAQRRRSV